MSVGTRPRVGATLRVRQERRGGLDPVELALFGALAVISLWTCGLAVWQIVVHGRHWTGTDGIYIVDQMQYLGWIQSAARHGLSANLFVLRGTPADYFQPAVLVSAALTKIGIAPWLALLVWKPISVVCAFLALRAYVRASLPGRLARRCALLLAVFYGGFSSVYGSFNVVGDLMPVFLSWGYTFGLLAIGLMVLVLILHARAREAGRLVILPGVLGALATTLHPWQGELIGVIVLGSEVVMWRLGDLRRRHLELAGATLLPIAVALLYYVVLNRADESWKLAREASKHQFALGSLLIACAPLILPALLAARPRRRDYLSIVTRVWPVAAFAVWLLSASALGATPLHAFDGLTLPLAVLAVEGIARHRPARLPHARAVLAAVLVAVTVPATVFVMHYEAELAAPASGNPNYITAGEGAALDYLATRAAPGGVLSRFYLGSVVPARTGRRTFVGDCLWSEPNCIGRAEIAQQLFTGGLTPAQTRSFVRESGARFLLDDCATPGPSRAALGPMVVGVHRFGCAAVLELAAPGPPSGPLAESPTHASVRPAWRQ